VEISMNGYSEERGSDGKYFYKFCVEKVKEFVV
jgi:hypothetical protein